MPLIQLFGIRVVRIDACMLTEADIAFGIVQRWPLQLDYLKNPRRSPIAAPTPTQYLAGRYHQWGK